MAQLLSKVTDLVQRTVLPFPSPLGMVTPAAGGGGGDGGGGSSGLVTSALGGSKAAFAPGMVEWLAMADRMHNAPLVKACLVQFRSMSSVPHPMHSTVSMAGSSLFSQGQEVHRSVLTWQRLLPVLLRLCVCVCVFRTGPPGHPRLCAQPCTPLHCTPW